MVCICSLMRTIMSINRRQRDEPFGYTRSVWLLIYCQCSRHKRDATLLRPPLISHQQSWPWFPHSSVEWLPKDTSLASFGTLMRLRHSRSVADPRLPHPPRQTFSFLVPHPLSTYHIIIMLLILYV